MCALVTGVQTCALPISIHKSQGGTVDRAHVLATPGMDRHSAYVASSRHRDGVQLHYGRDDFGDDRRLVRTLSRERAKDMASDYGRDRDAEIRAFADRRGLSGEIRLPERAERSPVRSEEHTSELQSLMRISYAVFCLKKK